MAPPDAIDAIAPDIERALPQSCPLEFVNGSDNDEPRQAVHTDEDLLIRAREINASGKFIFSCFSELNTFLLLRSQDEILRLQNKLHDSVKGKETWTDEDSDHLQKKLKQYHEALQTQKTISSWDHPPFKASHSAGEFLFGKSPPSTPFRQGSYNFPSSVAFRPPASVKDFDGSDYVDLCPQNSIPLNSFIRKVLPQHFIYHAADAKVVAYLQRKNDDNPIWRGSSASVSIIARVVISLISVVLLVVPMCALTYIQVTGYILLAAGLFATFFAVVVAISCRATNHEVFGVTAAYAAVIMVFVGNSIQNRYISTQGGG